MSKLLGAVFYVKQALKPINFVFVSMKNVLGFILMFSVLPAFAVAQQRPNIVVFLVDDMGWMDTSLPFADKLMPLNRQFHTPNMERLAREGVKFTNAYAASVCTPTRTSMLTGMNPAHSRITNWTSPLKDSNTDRSDDQLEAADWNLNGLSPVPGVSHTAYATPFPAILKDAGYFTIHVGKAHWGSSGTPGADPLNLGFMNNISGHAAGHPRSYLGTENYGNKKANMWAVPHLEEYHGTDTFLSEALTLKAIKALEEPIRNKQPFFLNMAHYAVHTPIMADKRFVQKYYDAGLDSTEAKYAALIEGMDKSLGDLMDYLEQKHVANNTIIIFMSDNGGLSLSPPRGAKEYTHNLPLKAGKGSLYEGGIREPMIVKWPGVVKEGSVNDQPLIIEDFFPSILEMAGLSHYEKVQLVDGQSFVPLLRGEQKAILNRALVWHYPNKWQSKDWPGVNYKSALRLGDWKLIYNMRDGKKELYNLKVDIGEHKDLASENPGKVKELAALLGQKLRAWNAVMPTFKASGKQVPWPDEIL